MKDMPNNVVDSFLVKGEQELDLSALVKLSLYLHATDEASKPYQIDYTILLMSYKLWGSKSLEEFCVNQTLSYFLFNPQNDSAVAREAMYMEIREFLMGK